MASPTLDRRGFRYAFSLTKTEVEAATPPGTPSHVLDSGDLSSPNRYDSFHQQQVRNLPQPSSDPADPLNWPLWRKSACLFCMSLWAWLSNFQSASISSAFPLMMHSFPPAVIPFSRLNHLVALNVLFLGVSNLIWAPLANTIGRRPVILVGSLAFTLCSVWAARASSFDSLLAARACMGIAAGNAEVVSPNVISEMFFIHQRGRAMAVYTAFLASGPIMGGTVGSYIAAAHGWRWINWTNVILGGCVTLLCFVFQPETMFNRENAQTHEHPRSGQRVMVTSKDDKTQVTRTENLDEVQHRPYTFRRSLAIGVYRIGFGRRIISPWLTLRFPGVWMVMLQYAGLVAGIITVSIVGAQLVSQPPYLWGHNAGLVNIGGLIGTLIGALWTYLVADRTLVRQRRQSPNKSTEPEIRLPAMIPGLTLATFGLWIFGAVGAHPSKYGWIGLEFGYGMICFGLMQVPSIGFNYIIEAYNAVSGDCLVMIVLLRAIISFAWTFFVGDWINKRGLVEPFAIFGMLMAIFTLITVPIYLWGKRLRIATVGWVPEVSEH